MKTVRNQKNSTVMKIEDFDTTDATEKRTKKKLFPLGHVRKLNATTQKENRNSSPKKEQNKF